MQNSSSFQGIGSFGEILFPTRCIGCRALSAGLCARCKRGWIFSDIHSFVEGVPVFSALRYNSVASHILLSAKEDGIREGDELLLAALRNSLGNLLKSGLGRSTLVPIPSSSRANRRRGRDFMSYLAQRLSEAEPAGVWNFLEHARKIQDQSMLSPAARRLNLSGAMRISSPGRLGRSVILVDDLMTTGATLGEAVKTMKANGNPVTGAITAFLALPIR